VLLLIVGGFILIMLGLVGEYVGRVFMCVSATPQYVERETVHAARDAEDA
jgi:undecaprenyl-phosphate 4-deoxy-4-formamido-L-arabinose transferase